MTTAKREAASAPSFRPFAVSGTQIGEVASVTHIATKQDMSRWTREHVDSPGITWSVAPGPGGTMLIAEHAHDRSSLPAEQTALRRGAVSGRLPRPLERGPLPPDNDPWALPLPVLTGGDLA